MTEFYTKFRIILQFSSNYATFVCEIGRTGSKVRKVGWYLIRQSGSHRIYKHKEINGIVVIPFHGSKEVPSGTAHSILKKQD